MHKRLTTPIKTKVRIEICARAIGNELIQGRRNREGYIVAAGAVCGCGVLASVLFFRACCR